MPIASYAPLLIPIAVVAIVLAFYYARLKRRSTRQGEMAKLATQLGMEFYPWYPVPLPQGCLFFAFLPVDDHPTEAFLARFLCLDPFGKGRRLVVTNLIVGGMDGNHWYIFDYEFTIGSGKNTHTEHKSIVAARVTMDMARLTLRPAGFFDRVGPWLGARDIQFESEEFNREFAVHCEHQEFAYAVIHPQAMEYLMSVPRYRLQLCGDIALIVLDGSSSPHEIYRAAVDLDGFLQRIPDYIRQDIGRPHYASHPLQ